MGEIKRRKKEEGRRKKEEVWNCVGDLDTPFAHGGNPQDRNGSPRPHFSLRLPQRHEAVKIYNSDANEFDINLVFKQIFDEEFIFSLITPRF